MILQCPKCGNTKEFYFFKYDMIKYIITESREVIPSVDESKININEIKGGRKIICSACNFEEKITGFRKKK